MSANTRESQEKQAKTLHNKRKAIRSQRGLKLPYVEPRPGFVQRWVRTQLDGKQDEGNVYKRKQEGWEARKSSTLKEGEFLPSVEHGKKGNNQAEMVVGTFNMILMERPQELHDEYRELVKEDIRLQQEAIDNDIMKFRGEETGQRMSSLNSEVHGGGRTPNIAPD